MPGGSGAAMRRQLLAIGSQSERGDTRIMAKKAAKGGKKKGGKKR